MDEHNLSESGALRVRIPTGLDIRLSGKGAEIELARMPFGMALELVNAQTHPDAPVGAYYKITFYRADARDESEPRAPMPGAIYLTAGGVHIRGAKPLPGTNRSMIDDSGKA